jgi:hypothetical protein
MSAGSSFFPRSSNYFFQRNSYSVRQTERSFQRRTPKPFLDVTNGLLTEAGETRKGVLGNSAARPLALK